MDDYISWQDYAKENDYKFILIVRDSEKELFPIYCNSTDEVFSVKRKMISESRMKIIEIISLE